MMKCVDLARLTDAPASPPSSIERSGGRSPRTGLIAVLGELKRSRANFDDGCKAAALNGSILASIWSWLVVSCVATWILYCNDENGPPVHRPGVPSP